MKIKFSYAGTLREGVVDRVGRTFAPAESKYFTVDRPHKYTVVKIGEAYRSFLTDKMENVEEMV